MGIQVTRRDVHGVILQAGVTPPLEPHGRLVLVGTNHPGESAYLTPQDAREFGQYLIELANQAEQ